ncbi:hypothetical protein C8T65DRAFT_737718 [Cerioporus squamosus]|nr:hypothetical protein C8T65DRAFT_737718 [Cerioporus squamosus]
MAIAVTASRVQVGQSRVSDSRVSHSRIFNLTGRGDAAACSIVEASRAKRIERQQARFRDRGGIFKPAEHNPLLDLLLARGVNGESPPAPTLPVDPAAADKKPSRGRKSRAAVDDAPQEPVAGPSKWPGPEKSSKARSTKGTKKGAVLLTIKKTAQASPPRPPLPPEPESDEHLSDDEPLAPVPQRTKPKAKPKPQPKAKAVDVSDDDDERPLAHTSRKNSKAKAAPAAGPSAPKAKTKTAASKAPPEDDEEPAKPRRREYLSELDVRSSG